MKKIHWMTIVLWTGIVSAIFAMFLIFPSLDGKAVDDSRTTTGLRAAGRKRIPTAIRISASQTMMRLLWNTSILTTIWSLHSCVSPC